MQCEQIRAYLDDYAAGTLPSYKASWLAQHTAACEACRQLAAEARARGRGREGDVPVAAAREPALLGRGAIGAVQRRRVPRWARWGGGLLTAAVLGATAWAVVRGVTRPERRPEPGAAAQTPGGASAPAPAQEQPAIATASAGEPVRYEATDQRQGEVQLSVVSVTAVDDTYWVTVHFDGSEIYTPGTAGAWITVRDSQDRWLESWVEGIHMGGDGLTARVGFRIPPVEQHFHLEFSGVHQLAANHWNIGLPMPPERLEQIGGVLGNLPPGVTLTRYGLVGDLLQVDLRSVDSLPRLYLVDGSGGRFAPVAESQRIENGITDTSWQYAIPTKLRSPLKLVGDGRIRKYSGPWMIELHVVR